MVQVKSKVIGMGELDDNLQKIARRLSPQGKLSDSLEIGAEAILEGARENLLANQLFRSGDLYDSGQTEKVNQFRVDVAFKMPYAAIHEYGGVIDVPVTEKSRGFFFWKHRITGDEKWLAMALSKKDIFKVHIPARPYLRPAIDENHDDAVELAAREMRRILYRG